MKRRALLFLLPTVFLLLLSTALAEETNFSAQRGLDWLLDKGIDGNYGSIVDTAMVTILLDEIGYTQEAENALDYLETQMNSDNCWPKTTCKVKDTAFVTYAKHVRLESTSEQKEWFTEAPKRLGTKGNWWFQMLDTGETGSCYIDYSYGTVTGSKNITVNSGNFTCGGSRWLDLNDCISPNLLSNNPTIDFVADCSDLGTPTLSIIYQYQNNLYLGLAESSIADAEFTINSGCYGEGYKASSCDYESSLWAYWALERIGSKTTAPLAYLLENYNEKDTIHNSIFYITNSDKLELARDLASKQSSVGDWDKNAFNTAVAVLALSRNPEFSQEVYEAQEWLESKQKEDGSWNSRVLDTAMVLFAAFSSEQYDTPSSSTPTPEVCNFDSICQQDRGESHANCPSDCYTECNENGECEEDIGENEYVCPEDCQTGTVACNEDGFCEPDYGENYLDCPFDCFCPDDVCDLEEEADESCPEDCGTPSTPTPQAYCGNNVQEGLEECDGIDDFSCPGECNVETCTCGAGRGGGFPWWLIIVIIIIGAIVFVYLQYIRKGKSLGSIFKKKPTRPTRPEFRPFSSALSRSPTQGMPPPRRPMFPPGQPFFRPRPRPSKGQKVESALEKSLGESKKLFRKK